MNRALELIISILQQCNGGGQVDVVVLQRVPAEAVAEHAVAAQLRGGAPAGGEERAVERRLAVRHVGERGPLRALGGGENGVEEVRGGSVREEVAAQERELEAHGGGGLEAADAEEGEVGGAEAASYWGLQEEEAAAVPR
ncbi:unnamed protein product [Miscanthus lutarioriparius]|uniref:Uncharacterized protein n=1 Tax=Miscanthus lutarioriparius TaxID=422564 RepID=A0A811RUD6_9POAL|nr:unnamed protein product [Miscanthus lutarioriparius]